MQLQRRAALAAQMGLKAQASAGASVTLKRASGWHSRPASVHAGSALRQLRPSAHTAVVSTPCSPARHAPALPSLFSPQGLETYKGSWDCAVQILRNHGIKGLYRGMTSTVLRDIQVRSAARAVAGCAARAAAGCGGGLLRSPAGG